MKRRLPSLGFIGAGKVGAALATGFHRQGYRVRAIHSRTSEAASELARRVEARLADDPAGVAAAADLVFITTPDDAVERVAALVAERGNWRPGQIVVHTSGALSSRALRPARDQGAHVASAHPLQTFPARHLSPSYVEGTSFAVEGDPEALAVVEDLIHSIGGRSFSIRAEDKPIYHAAASIASNYTVTVFALAVRMLQELGLEKDAAAAALLPLVRATVESLENPGLPECLTGPIARGDAGTVQAHLAVLCQRFPDIVEVYRLLGRQTLPIGLERGSLTRETAAKLAQELGEHQAEVNKR